jgi:glutamine phosphoribosylpyrophosphate amidotransferase
MGRNIMVQEAHFIASEDNAMQAIENKTIPLIQPIEALMIQPENNDMTQNQLGPTISASY